MRLTRWLRGFQMSRFEPPRPPEPTRDEVIEALSALARANLCDDRGYVETWGRPLNEHAVRVLEALDLVVLDQGGRRKWRDAPWPTSR